MISIANDIYCVILFKIQEKYNFKLNLGADKNLKMKVIVTTEHTGSGFRNSGPVEVLKGLHSTRVESPLSIQNTFTGFLVKKENKLLYSVAY